VYNTIINDKGEINMKKLTIKQKQAIYEHLLTLNCPDLLAALIAERSTRYSRHIDTTIYNVIADNFTWDTTPEESDGSEFWYEIYEESVELENTTSAGDQHVAVTIAERGGFPEVYESYAPMDIEIRFDKDDLVTIPQSQPDESLELAWWNKAKLFLGKLLYRV
jgi:hypothetical protein